MPEYHAVYRVLEQDSRRTESRADFYDEDPRFNTTGEHFMSFAYELGDLDTDQLGELKNRVGEICVSEDWSVDQGKYGTIFLIEGSIYAHIGKELGADTKLSLKNMRERYVKAKASLQFDKTIIAPLAHCINIAQDIRESSEIQRQEAIAPPPAGTDSSASGSRKPGQPKNKLYDWLADKKQAYADNGQRRTIEQLVLDFNRLTARERAEILGGSLNDSNRITIPDDPQERKRLLDRIYSALQRRKKT